ncbi:MAG TPA: SUMF1/EgtB/PvdO family nonheme iron enzyme [Hyphomicrobiaceae bacterium]|nr:SUMF1/EgtB/PvdO family nonheme iron enzyme [Hyphomicrobiaceae bacterium]
MAYSDIVFWLLIILIGALAFSIESGVAVRHRRVVLSSIFAATLAAIYMMFLGDDHSRFGFLAPPKAAKKDANKKEVLGTEYGGREKPAGAEVKKAGIETDNAKETARLLAETGGFRDCPVCPLMIGIKKGSIDVGSPKDEAGRNENEGPRKTIYFKRPLAVSRYEIQRGEFRTFIQEARYSPASECFAGGRMQSDVNWLNPGIKQEDNHPVVCISIADAEAFSKWLSRKTEKRYRVPNESEWEYAARGGTKSAYWQGQPIGDSDANFRNQYGGTLAVGRTRDNPFGLFDVQGNVWEFTADCYVNDVGYLPGSGRKVAGFGDCSRRAIRGGAWDSSSDELRSARRRPIGVGVVSNTIGMRVVREFD